LDEATRKKLYTLNYDAFRNNFFPVIHSVRVGAYMWLGFLSVSIRVKTWWISDDDDGLYFKTMSIKVA